MSEAGSMPTTTPDVYPDLPSSPTAKASEAAPSTTCAAVATNVGETRKPVPMPPPSHVVALIRTTPSCTFWYRSANDPGAGVVGPAVADTPVVGPALVGDATGPEAGALLCTISCPVGTPAVGELVRCWCRTAAPPTPAAATASTATVDTTGMTHAGRRRRSAATTGAGTGCTRRTGPAASRRQSRTGRPPPSGC